MRGARGRESRYAPSEPKEVIKVRRMRAGMGGMREPTKIFCSRAKTVSCRLAARAPQPVLTRTTAPGTLHECFHMPVTMSTPTVCHQPVVLLAMYDLISADRI
jgi:hypothetical protein